MTTLEMLDSAGSVLGERFGLYARTILPFDLCAAAAFLMMIWGNVNAAAFPSTVRDLLPFVVVLLLVMRTLAQAVYVRAIVRWVEGSPESMLRAWRHVMANAIAILLPGLLTLVTLLGTIILYPMVAPRASLVLAVAAVEGGRPFNVWKERRAMRGTRAQHPVASIIFVSGAAVALYFVLHLAGQQSLDRARSMLDLPVTNLRAQLDMGNEFYMKMLIAAALVALGAFRGAYVALAYLDARVRTDGFDLRLRLDKVRRQREELAAHAEERAALLRALR